MKKIYFFLLLASCLSLAAYSQDDQTSLRTSEDGIFNARAPYCTPCQKRHYGACPPPTNNQPVPFDGGLSILLIAGAAYGVKRIRGKKSDSV